MKTPGEVPGEIPGEVPGWRNFSSAAASLAGSRGLRLADERASGTVITLGLILLGLSLTVGVAQIAVASTGSTIAHSAADLAAIAGATDLLSGGNGCDTAREYATKNHTTLVSCQVRDWLLRVEVVKPLGFGLVHEVRAKAKAGPEFAEP